MPAEWRQANGDWVLASNRGPEIGVSDPRATCCDLPGLLENLLSQFVHPVLSADLDEAIASSLAMIGQFADVDRIVLSQEGQKKGTLISTHSWVRNAGIKIPRSLSSAEFPWAASQLRSGQTILARSLDSLPAEAFRLRDRLAELGSWSHLSVPLVDNIGALSLGTKGRHHPWPHTMQAHIRLIARILASALARRKTRDDLKESEACYRALFEMSGVAVFIVEGTRIADCNQYALQMFGCPAKDGMVGHGPWDFSPETQPDGRSSREKSSEALAAAVRGEPQVFEWQHLRRDGTLFDSEVSLSRIDIGDRHLIQGAVRDVTERNRMLRALRESERRFKLLADNVPGFFSYVGQGRRFRSLTPRHERLRGRPVSEIIGSEVRDLIGETSYRQIQPHLDAALSGQESSWEMPIAVHSSEPSWVSGTLVPDIDDRGDVRGAFALIQDVSARYDVLQKLEDSTAQLRSLGDRLAKVEEEEKQRLARNLHDLVGQNLTALGMNLQTARKLLDHGQTPEAVGRLTDSSNLVEETSELVRNLTSDLRPPVLDDYGLLSALRWYGLQLGERANLSVAVCGFEREPRLPREIEIGLFRIAQEALTNVVKHASADHASLILQHDAETTTLRIEDDGIGFDPSNVTPPRPDSGWGLLNMHERAEGIGGRFTLTSSSGEGTTVRVEVPRC